MLHYSTRPLREPEQESLNAVLRDSGFQVLKKGIANLVALHQVDAGAGFTESVGNDANKIEAEDNAKKAYLYQSLLDALNEIEAGKLKLFDINITTNIESE